MVAFLIEHFAGAFPTWLAPIQARVLTVSEQFTDYGKHIVERLRRRFIRAEMGSGGDTVSKKIREGTMQKIPNLLIVGEKETEEGTVTLRRYGEKQQHTLPLDTFEQAITRTIETRSLSFLLPKN
jgi:threonyl-tRNA synthetase